MLCLLVEMAVGMSAHTNEEGVEIYLFLIQPRQESQHSR